MPRPALGLIETSGIDGAIAATRAASDAGRVVIVSAERSDSDRMTVKIEGDWAAVQKAIEAGARAADKAGQFISMHVIPRSDSGVSPILPYPRFVDRYQPDDRAPSRRKPRTTRPRKRTRTAAPAETSTGPAPLPVRPEQSRVAQRSEAAAAPVPPPVVVPESSAVEPVPPPVVVPERPAVEPPPRSVEPSRVAESSPVVPGAEFAAVGDEIPWDVLQAMAVVKLRKYARMIVELPIKGREISKANKQQLLEAIASVRKGRS